MRMGAHTRESVAAVLCLILLVVSCSPEPDAGRQAATTAQTQSHEASKTDPRARNPAAPPEQDRSSEVGAGDVAAAGPFALKLERVGDVLTASGSGPRDRGAFRVIQRADLTAWGGDNPGNISDAGFFFLVNHFRDGLGAEDGQEFHFKRIELRATVDGREEVVVYGGRKLPPPGTMNPTVRGGRVYIESPRTGGPSDMVTASGRIAAPDGGPVFGDFSIVLESDMTEWARELGSQWAGMRIGFFGTENRRPRGAEVPYGGVDWRPLYGGRFRAHNWLTGGANPEGDSSPELGFTLEDVASGPYAVKLERSGDTLTASATGPGDEGVFRVIQRSDLRNWMGRNPGDLSEEGFYFRIYHFRDGAGAWGAQQFHFTRVALETSARARRTRTVFDAERLLPAGTLNPAVRGERVYVTSPPPRGTFPTRTGRMTLPRGRLVEGDFTLILESDMERWARELGSLWGGLGIAFRGTSDNTLDGPEVHYGEVRWSTWSDGAFVAYHWSVVDERSDNPNGGPEIPLVAQTFSELLETYAEVIDRFPRHEQSSKVARMLVEAAVREGMADGESPEATLMYRFADDNLGLYLFDAIYERLAGESHEKAMEFLGRVALEAPGTAIAAMTMAKKLSYVLDRSPEDFLAQCDGLLDDGEAGRAARIALHMRIEHWAARGEVTAAALDALRFWALYPEVVERAAMKVSLAAYLREAGLLLEADVLEQPETAAIAAKSFHEEFASLGLSEPGMDSLAESLPFLQAYCRFAPDVDRIRGSAPPNDDGGFEAALYWSRLGRLAVRGLDGDTAVELYESYLDRVGHLLEGDRLDGESAAILGAVHKASLDALSKLFGEGGFSADVKGSWYRPGTDEADYFLSLFSKTGVRLACRVEETKAGLDSSGYWRSLDNHVEFVKGLQYHKEVIAAYSEFLERFPDSNEAPECMLRMGDYLGQDLESRTQAVETYRRLVQRFPEAPQAGEARFKEGMTLYEMGWHADAHGSFLLFLAEQPQNGKLVQVKLHSAFCEAALGMGDEAGAHLRELAEEFPDDPVADQVLFSLGKHAYANREYLEAIEVFKRLLKNHPGSEYGERARGLADELSTLVEDS